MNFPPAVVKPFNYLATAITEDYTILPDTYNLIYAQPAAPSTLTLPELEDVIDGFPVIMRNFGPSTLEVREDDGGLVTTLNAGSTFIIIADKQSDPVSWKTLLGPIGGGVGVPVSGPGLTTDSALVVWNGTTGESIKNSVIIVDGSGNMAGVGTLVTSGAVQLGGNLTMDGSLIFSDGVNTTSLQSTPVGTNFWTLRNTTDNVVGINTTDTLTNKTLTSTTNNVAANYLNTATSQVNISDSPAPLAGYAMVATSPTEATWQALDTGVNGPVSSTTNAVAIWGDTLGGSLKNSLVVIDSLGNITGVNNLSSGGNISLVNLTLVGGNISYQNGGNVLTLNATPTAARNITIPDASDTLVGRATTDTLSNKTINYTPADSDNWLSTPTTVSGALDNLASTAGSVLTLGVDPSVTATGTVQGDAYTITKYFTNVTTTAAGTGVVLPSATQGLNHVIKNNGANDLNVYPDNSANINALATDAAFTLTSGSSQRFIATSSTHWETV